MGSGQRVEEIEGLRAIAALGVVWIHNWTFFGNPALYLPGTSIDLNRVVAPVGQGVDLFFVISGFCMYLMYRRSFTSISIRSWMHFLVRRWLRIAPAFYAACVCSAVVLFATEGSFPLRALLLNLGFVHTIPTENAVLAPPFWSLATEWHFYLILPLLFYAISRFGISITFTVLLCVGLLYRAYLFKSVPLENIDDRQLSFLLVEFMWGVCAAHLYTNAVALPSYLMGTYGILLGVLVAYVGRLLKVTEVVNFFEPFGYISKAIAEPVMSLGFALILCAAIFADSPIARTLRHSAFRFVGRWSYSIYLWHWWIALVVSNLIGNLVGQGAFGQICSFILILIVLIPMAALSYRLFEAPYFARRHTPHLRSDDSIGRGKSASVPPA